ncbi:MAG: hypothetical protein IJ752_04120 [Alphaproteobacteria bacterium]|nr:hypothetical protein [Alphaproteobacteria bacterium]
MDSQQSSAPQPMVKKVLVKRVKVLVKRPVAAPTAAAPAPQPSFPVKAPTQNRIMPTTPAFTQTTPIPSAPASGASSFQQTPAVPEKKPPLFKLPDDILGAVERQRKIPKKAFLLYIYARTYAEQVAEEEGYDFPPMLIELPRDISEVEDFINDADSENFFDAILSDLAELSPFIDGMEEIVKTTAPLEKIVQSELQRIQDKDLTTADQIILAFLNLLLDMAKVREKLELLKTEKEMNNIINDIKEIDEEEKDTKKLFIDAINRKHFPVDATKLVNNYFNLAKKDPDKAYETLITNPLFFSPIQMERMPKKFFGLVKPSAKDAIAVNKQLASFFKHLKV